MHLPLSYCNRCFSILLCFAIAHSAVCLQFLAADGIDEVHFFGDNTYKGGNDHEIFEHTGTIGHTVTNWQDTMRQVKEILAQDDA